MKFSNIVNAINTSDSFIKSLDPGNITHKEIESHIVSGLVMLMVSEYEVHFEMLFNLRASRCGDGYVCNYIKKALNNSFRSPDLSKINETLKKFDTTYSEEVLSYQAANPQVKNAWDTMMKARHYITHKHGNAQITFLELKALFLQTQNLIAAVENILEG
ncbi:HEPN domain-containing protein [Acinetobacter johnsonii]|uniref:HEPN domain-containing protein n=1 Tax=Acinetobacter johnsonii TaxID=40214 RepID=UPI0032B3154E